MSILGDLAMEERHSQISIIFPQENGCDENVAHVLADAHAQDYIANFARNKISWQILRDMKDDDLKQVLTKVEEVAAMMSAYACVFHRFASVL